MAFPTTSLLDDFNRANEVPATTNWSGPMESGDGSMNVNSNRLRPDGAGFSASWYDLSTFGPDCEAWVTIDTKETEDAGQMEVRIRLQDVGTAGLDGYIVRYLPKSGTDVVQIRRFDNGSTTQLGADINQDFDAGDGLGIECIGNQISAYRRSAGVWSLLGTRTDSTYTGAGYIGLADHLGNAVGFFDDFGGGTVVVAPPPPVTTFDYSRFPKTKMRLAA